MRLRQRFRPFFSFGGYPFRAALGLVLVSALIPAGGWLFIAAPPVRDFAVSPVLLDRQGRLYHARLSADGEWLLPRPLAEMGPWLPKVVTAVEDRRFYRHPGVDLWALGRAVWQNIAHGRVVSGASTLTVQLVRLHRPARRTVFNKYVEFVQALKIERTLGKDELLELYLNRAPFGGNLRGAESAARFYFDKRARDLSLGESALLAALLRGPSLYRPDRNPGLARRRRDMILERLAAKGVITRAEADAARAEPVTGRRGRPPRRAWHLAETVLSQPGESPALWRWGRPGREYGLKTTLDLDWQDQLERRLRLGLADFPERITGAGAVMDNASGGLLAYVGNARWTEDGGRHWVDCARARRSPGSALKPFVYLAAFQQKGLTPATLLADTPWRLSGQAPRNFDNFYRGPVSAQTALADSLNAPAVRVLRLVGYQAALDALKRAGFSYLGSNSAYYGDSLVLGGCEVDLWQLLRAYGLLARQGLSVEPTWRPPAAPPPPGRRLFPAGAVWLVNESLKDDSRLPAGPRLNQEFSAGARPAFKTGTSHGWRDAWLAAYTPAHTLVFWAGDPQGRGHPRLTAIDALGPLLGPMLGALRDAGSWPGPPADLEPYPACPLSGEPAGPYCPGRHWTYRQKAGARSHPCRLHVLRGGRAATLWPPELAGFMAALEPPGAGGRPAGELAVTSPRPGGVIVLEGAEGRIPLKCEGAAGMVYWYVDDEFHQAAPAGLTPTLTVTPGRHRVTLVDGAGRTAAAEFTVLYAQERDRDRDVPVLAF